MTGEGMAALLDHISSAFEEEKSERVFDLGFAEGKRHAWLHGAGVVLQETQTETGWQMQVLWTARQEKRYRDL